MGFTNAIKLRETSTKRDFCLPFSHWKGLASYFSVLLILSITGAVFQICYWDSPMQIDKNSGLPLALLTSILFPSLIGSSVRYIRKIYLLCFSEVKENNLCINENCDNCAKKTGALIYFITRPLLISVTTYFLLLAFITGVFLTLNPIASLTSYGYWGLSAISFFIGMGGGHAISKGFTTGRRLIDSLLVND